MSVCSSGLQVKGGAMVTQDPDQAGKRLADLEHPSEPHHLPGRVLNPQTDTLTQR